MILKVLRKRICNQNVICYGRNVRLMLVLLTVLLKYAKITFYSKISFNPYCSQTVIAACSRCIWSKHEAVLRQYKHSLAWVEVELSLQVNIKLNQRDLWPRLVVKASPIRAHNDIVSLTVCGAQRTFGEPLYSWIHECVTSKSSVDARWDHNVCQKSL